jgi:hypothetical protein
MAPWTCSDTRAASTAASEAHALAADADLDASGAPWSSAHAAP